MAEHGTHTADYQRFQNEGSNNVSADGNFSVQVLHKALEVWGLTATPLGKQSSPDNVCTDLEAERAFICHMMHHWFTVRKVCGQWWNFNSLLPAPAPLSPFHLSTLIGWLQNEGCTIFIVRGNLPDNMMSLSDPPRQARLMTAQEVRQCKPLHAYDVVNAVNAMCNLRCVPVINWKPYVRLFLVSPGA